MSKQTLGSHYACAFHMPFIILLFYLLTFNSVLLTTVSMEMPLLVMFEGAAEAHTQNVADNDNNAKQCEQRMRQCTCVLYAQLMLPSSLLSASLTLSSMLLLLLLV